MACELANMGSSNPYLILPRKQSNDPVFCGGIIQYGNQFGASYVISICNDLGRLIWHELFKIHLFC